MTATEPRKTPDPHRELLWLNIIFATLLFCLAGGANALRNTGLSPIGIPDWLIQARHDPMATTTPDGYRQCSQEESTSGLLGESAGLTRTFDTGTHDSSQAVTQTVHTATQHAWTGHYDADGAWLGQKPRILGGPRRPMRIMISWDTHPITNPTCHLRIEIGGA
jgi:hypothetical protein